MSKLNLGAMVKPDPVPRQTSSRQVTTLVVRRRAIPDAPHLARLQAGQTTILAAIGKAGVTCQKREGDHATPVGRYGLNRPLFRADRLPRIRTLCGSLAIRPVMGWCDDRASFLYNRPVRAGLPYSHERLWRDDGVYDVILSTSHNQRPRIRGAGSAIFLHLARAGYAATEGCVAVSLPDLRRLLPRLGRKVRLVIAP